MTVELHENLVVLSGNCGVEEAEPLLAALLDMPGRAVAIDTARIHTSLWQVLLALRPVVLRTPDDTFVVRYLRPWLLDDSQPAGRPTELPSASAAPAHTHGVD